MPSDDKLYELTDHFATLNQHENLSNVETEGEDTSQQTMQQPQHENADQTEEMIQRGSSQKISRKANT